MIPNRPHTRALFLAVAGVAVPVLTILAVGVAAAAGKTTYEVVRDLFVPLVGPLVAVLIPVVILFVIPYNQTRQKLALDLCAQYYTEEMRDARNTAWHHFVTEQRTLPPVRRAERLNHFLDYLSNPDVHRAVDPVTDAVYQKTSRVLDFFALVDGCVNRRAVDPDVVRGFLLFYYLWWRDEIMDPLRKTQRVVADHPKVRPAWWGTLADLDALVGPASESAGGPRRAPQSPLNHEGPPVPRTALAALAGLLAVAADWPQFRGPAGTGVTAAPAPPADWSQADVAWTAKLPGGGWAQPVVSGGVAYVTTAVSDPPIVPKGSTGGMTLTVPRQGGKSTGPPDVTVDWRLIALDLKTGETKWSRSVAAGKPKHTIHPSNTYATETPVVVGDKVVAYFGATGTLAAFDPAGTELWKAELGTGPTANGFGTASSPAAFAGKVYLMQHHDAAARLLCVDPATGKTVWEQKRDKPSTSWATPFVWAQAKRTDIVCCGRGLVTGHDPATGAEVWRVGGLDSTFSSTPAATADRLYFGSSGPGSVAPLFALKAGAVGDCTLAKGATANEHVAWYKKGAGPAMASPVAVGDKLFVLGNSGLVCYDGATGEQLYKERLPKLKTVAASPFVAGGRLVVVDETGAVVTVNPGPPLEVVGQATIDDTVWASPTPVDGGLLIRGVNGLYCVRK